MSSLTHLAVVLLDDADAVSAMVNLSFQREPSRRVVVIKLTDEQLAKLAPRHPSEVFERCWLQQGTGQ